jgi:hypothetical protein
MKQVGVAASGDDFRRVVAGMRVELGAVTGVDAVGAKADAQTDAQRQSQSQRLMQRSASAAAGAASSAAAVTRRGRAGHVRLAHGRQIGQTRHAAALGVQVDGQSGVRVGTLV